MGEGSRTHTLAAGITAVLAMVVVMSMHAQALTSKLLTQIGVTGIDPKISTLVTTMLKPADNAGASDVNTFISAGVAVMLLIAVGTLIYSLAKIMMGSRGGGERLFAVLGGMVAAIACVQILA